MTCMQTSEAFDSFEKPVIQTTINTYTFLHQPCQTHLLTFGTGTNDHSEGIKSTYVIGGDLSVA